MDPNNSQTEPTNPNYSQYYSTHFRLFSADNYPETSRYYQALLGSRLPPAKDAKMLEIGAGLGTFARFLKSQGYTNLECIDISPEQARMAQEINHIEVIAVPDPLSYLGSLPDCQYQAVFMLDVIEHLKKESILAYLGQIRRILKPTGSLFLSTENMASPFGGRIQNNLDFTHEYNFSEVTLHQVLAMARFSDIQIWGAGYFQPTGIKSWLTYVLRWVWFKIIWFIYKIERPGSIIPLIYDKELVAAAIKRDHD